MLEHRLDGPITTETPAALAAFLKAARGGPVQIVIHSPGGNALAGAAAYGQLRAYAGRVAVVVEGIAASAASLIAMGASPGLLSIHGGSFLMIHEAHVNVEGPAADLRQTADVLDRVSATYRRAYAERSGKSEAAIAELMEAETWMDAEEAVAMGFADAVIVPLRIAASIDLSTFDYRNAPGALRRGPQGETTMSETKTKPAPQGASLDQIEAIAARANLGAEFVVAQLKAQATEAAAQGAALDAMAAAANAAVTPSTMTARIEVGTDHTAPAALADRMAGAIVARFTGKVPEEKSREFAGLSLAGMGEAMLKRRGMVAPARRLSDAEAIQMSLTTDDFPTLLRGTSQRLLQDRLAATPGAARMACVPRTVRDFRTFNPLIFSGVATLSELAEAGPIQHAPPSERAETARVKTFARAMRFTRQALVNDDLAALSQINLIANGVIATEGAEFVKLFVTNGGGWGPTMSDGNPLFSAAHNNVATGVMGTAGLGAARLVMRGQTDPSGVLIAPTPRLLLVSPTNETAAEQTLSQLTVATAESGRPVFANSIAMMLEPRLSGAPYFLMASPDEAPIAGFFTIESSNGIPQVSEHETSGFDGLDYKVTHDFAIAPLSWIGAVRSTGA